MFKFGALALSLTVLAAIQSSAILNSKTDAEANQTNWTLNDDSWNYWWSYSGVSGPSYWGLLNLDWFICDKGRRQSPINIDTSSLVYDPSLSPLRADNNLISGLLYNDGHAIVFNASIILPKISATEISKTGQLLDGAAAAAAAAESGGVKGGQMNSSLLFKRGNIVDLQHQAAVDDTNLLLFGNGALSIEDPAELKLAAGNILSGEFSETSNDIASVDVGQRQLESVLASNNGNTNDIDRTGGAEQNAMESAMEANSANNQEINNQPDLDAQDSNNPSGQWPLGQNGGVQFSGAGLAYTYRFELLYLRFALNSNLAGSEHQIDSRFYPAEVQLIAYNNQLYKSFADTSTKPMGLLAISILVNILQLGGERRDNTFAHTQSLNQQTVVANKTIAPISNVSNEQLNILLNQAAELANRGSSKPLRGFNLTALLPETNYFVTYEGSLSTPGCHESVTWLLMNKPLYMTQVNLDSLRSLSADEPSRDVPSGTLIAGNIRPIQPVNNRPIRTNIRPTSKSNQHPETCKRLWTRYEYKQTNI